MKSNLIRNDNEFLNYLLKYYYNYKCIYNIDAYELVKIHMLNRNMLRINNSNLDLAILSIRGCIEAIKQETYDSLPYVILPYSYNGDLYNDVLNYIKDNSDFLNDLKKYREYLGAIEFLIEENILNANITDELFIIYCISKFLEIYIYENKLIIQSNNNMNSNPQFKLKEKVMKTIEMEKEMQKEMHNLNEKI